MVCMIPSLLCNSSAATAVAMQRALLLPYCGIAEVDLTPAILSNIKLLNLPSAKFGGSDSCCVVVQLVCSLY
jgi:hypothetical protein